MRTPGTLLGLVLAIGFLAQPSQPAATTTEPEEFRISGTVVDATTGAVLAHARVALAPTTKRDDLHSVITGEDGRFVFEHLKPGKYSISASAKGHLPQSFNQHDQYSSAIAVGSGLNSEDLVFRLSAEGSVLGRVLDDQGEPVRNARVLLFRTGTPNGRQATFPATGAFSNDDGAFRFSHLAPGKYYVCVSAHPWYGRYTAAFKSIKSTTAESRDENDEKSVGSPVLGPPSSFPEPASNPALDVAYPITFYPDATDASAAIPIVLGPGEKFVANISLHPIPALHLRVAVKRSEGVANEKPQVKKLVFGTVLVSVHSESSLIDAAWAIGGLPPGRYIFDTRNLLEDGINTNLESREVEVLGDGEVPTGKDRSFSQVSGVVKVDRPAAAVPEGRVQLRNHRTGATSAADIGTKGEFKFTQELVAGNYDLLFANTANWMVKSISAAEAKIAGHAVQLRGTGEVHLTVELTQALGRIDGIALRDDKSLDGAMAVLVPQDPTNNLGLFRRDQSDSDGTFTLNYILPGNYTIVAIANHWDLEWSNPEALKPYLAQGTPIQVEAGGKYEIKVKVQ